MEIKGFAVDIDGTITDDDLRLNLDAAFALRWLEKLGYKVVLVSGRSVWEVYYAAILVGTTRVVVGENGGVVAISPDNLLVLGDSSQTMLAYDYLSKKIKDVKLKPAVPRLTETILLRTFNPDLGRKLLGESKIPVYLNDSKFAYHLTNRGIDKSVGLKRAMNHLGINLEDVVAIGDSETDIPMMEACGYSVAVGKNSEEARRKASITIATKSGNNFKQSIQHVLEKFLKVSLTGS